MPGDGPDRKRAAPVGLNGPHQSPALRAGRTNDRNDLSIRHDKISNE